MVELDREALAIYASLRNSYLRFNEAIENLKRKASQLLGSEVTNISIDSYDSEKEELILDIDGTKYRMSFSEKVLEPL